MRLKGLLLLFIFLSSVVFLASCDFEYDPCANDPDSRHCYQNEAVKNKDPSYCAKIEAPEGFKKSNPPKDKCYMMVAEETLDAKYCRLMEGGEGSYEKADCVTTIAKETRDLASCHILSGKEKTDCISQVSPFILVTDIEEMDLTVQSKLDELKGDPRNKILQKELAELKKQRDELYDNAPPSVQREHFRNERRKILEGIEDADVLSAISKEFIDYRKANKDATPSQLLEQMAEIKEQKELMKSLDDKANELIDKIKGGATDYVNEKADAAVDELKSQGWKWAKSKMSYDLSKLEDLKKKYDKGSAMYNSINEKVEKFKKVYDEVNEVYKKVDKVNKLLAEGKIDAGKAKVLKGAVYLGKGLEYATEYVPIFGSTISTISKETFDMTIKLATKRAQRSTSLEKCFDDPANCDLDGITGY